MVAKRLVGGAWVSVDASGTSGPATSTVAGSVKLPGPTASPLDTVTKQALSLGGTSDEPTVAGLEHLLRHEHYSTLEDSTPARYSGSEGPTVQLVHHNETVVLNNNATIVLPTTFLRPTAAETFPGQAEMRATIFGRVGLRPSERDQDAAQHKLGRFPRRLTVTVIQDEVGGRTITWGSQTLIPTIVLASGQPAQPATTANKATIYEWLYVNELIGWIGKVLASGVDPIMVMLPSSARLWTRGHLWFNADGAAAAGAVSALNDWELTPVLLRKRLYELGMTMTFGSGGASVLTSPMRINKIEEGLGLTRAHQDERYVHCNTAGSSSVVRHVLHEIGHFVDFRWYQHDTDRPVESALNAIPAVAQMIADVQAAKLAAAAGTAGLDIYYFHGDNPTALGFNTPATAPSEWFAQMWGTWIAARANNALGDSEYAVAATPTVRDQFRAWANTYFAAFLPAV